MYYMPNHYSIAVNELHTWLSSDSSSEKPVWRKEADIPVSAGHASCAVLSTLHGPSKLYFFGGEANDYYPKDASAGDYIWI